MWKKGPGYYSGHNLVLHLNSTALASRIENGGPSFFLKVGVHCSYLLHRLILGEREGGQTPNAGITAQWPQVD